MSRIAVVLPFAISGGEVKPEMGYSIATGALYVVLIMVAAIVMAYAFRSQEFVALGIVACIVLPIAFSGTFFPEKPTGRTTHAPYKITGTLTKVEENSARRDQSDVILSDGEKVKVNEYMRDLTKFVGQEIVLKCDYDKMPEKKITNKTECDLSGSGSTPNPPSVSN